MAYFFRIFIKQKQSESARGKLQFHYNRKEHSPKMSKLVELPLQQAIRKLFIQHSSSNLE